MKSKRVANIINFIRGEDPRVEQKVLYDTFVKQLELCKKYPMPYTFLMQYDAFVKPEYAKLLKENADKNMEIGVWIELAREQIEKVGLSWRGNPDWKWDWHACPDLLVAYSLDERKLLIDELMGRFFSVFGFYPRSVGSWMLDSFSVGYMAEKYNIDAFIICREQYGTDGYTLWGGYYNGAYFPSRKNMFIPAQTKQEQIHTPVFRLLGIDHLHQYDNDHVMTLEPSWECGQDSDWVDWYFKSNFCEENISFSYTQVGQENPFTWERFGKALEMQTEKLYEYFRQNKLEVLTLADTGKWFSNNYEMTPPAAITSLEDWKNEGCQSVWYNCKNYRANIFNDGKNLSLRDIQVFSENYEDRYLNSYTSEHWAIYDTLPVIDGYRWGKEDKKSYLYFVKPGSFERVSGRIINVSKNSDNSLRIELEVGGESVTCLFNELTVSFEFKNAVFELLFEYSDMKETELDFINENRIGYCHFGAKYGVFSDDALFISEENGYRIVPRKKDVSIGFWK